MVNTTEKLYILAIIVTIIVNAFGFALGITEAVFASKYDIYKYDCNGIWGWIVAASVIDISVPILTCCGLTAFVTNNNNNVDNTQVCCGIPNLLHIGTIIIAVWSAVTYFNISSSCYEFLQSVIPEFWVFIMIHFSFLWISIGSMVIITCIACCILCVAETSVTGV